MKRKHIILGVVAIILVILLIPAVHLVVTRLNEDDGLPITPTGYVDDASQLNLTKVDTIIQIASGQEEIVDQLIQILKYAQKNGLKISVAGAKHSMGGHTIYPNGIVLNMLPYKHMSLDTNANILTIGSGALWRDAIRYLDQFDRSISVMQAFSSFSVGGSMSVNGHGWQRDLPPLSSSIVSFTLLKSNGEVVECSRQNNSELFRLVIGGYGLFGVILDVRLKVVKNVALRYNYIKLDPRNYVQYYDKYVSNNPRVNLVFGRLRISDKHFLEEAVISMFEEAEAGVPPLLSEKSTEAQRLVFRGSVDSEYGKRLRWNLESGHNKFSKNTLFSRNELLNDDVSLIENRDTSSTDILQKYFIPKRHFNQYLAEMKAIMKHTEVDLLNITIRAVQHDTDSYLSYAREDVFGFVLLFNQYPPHQVHIAC